MRGKNAVWYIVGMIRWIMPVPMVRGLRDMRAKALLHMVMVIDDDVRQMGGGKGAIERRQRQWRQ